MHPGEINDSNEVDCVMPCGMQQSTAAQRHEGPQRTNRPMSCTLQCRAGQALVARQLRPYTTYTTRGCTQHANRIVLASVIFAVQCRRGLLTSCLLCMHCTIKSGEAQL